MELYSICLIWNVLFNIPKVDPPCRVSKYPSINIYTYICLFERARGRDREIFHLLALSPRWLQLPRLDQAETRNRVLHPGLPLGTSPTALSRAFTGIGLKAEHLGCTHRLDPLCRHNAGPSFLKWNTNLMYDRLFHIGPVHLCVGHLNCFYEWRIYKCCSMNMGIHISLGDFAFSSFTCIPTRGVAGLYVNIVSKFLEAVLHCFPWWLRYLMFLSAVPREVVILS